MNYKFLVVLIILLSNSSFAKTRHNQKITKFNAVIISCHDGDTCRVKYKDNIIKIRLAGIDAPEIKQKEGKQSKEYLENQILGKDVEFDCKGKSYDRIVCTLFLKGANVNEDMVRMGYAFDYAKYSNGKYKRLMDSAQANRLGIWKTLVKSPFCTRHVKNENCIANLLYNQ